MICQALSRELNLFVKMEKFDTKGESYKGRGNRKTVTGNFLAIVDIE